MTNIKKFNSFYTRYKFLNRVWSQDDEFSTEFYKRVRHERSVHTGVYMLIMLNIHCTSGIPLKHFPCKRMAARSRIRGVAGRTDQTSGGCSLGETIPKKPKTPISKVERFGR